jgi:hypothetical protein
MFDENSPGPNGIATLRVGPPVRIKLIDAKPLPESKAPTSFLSDSHEIQLLPGDHRVRIFSNGYGAGTQIWSDDHTMNIQAKAGSIYRVKVGYHAAGSPAHGTGVAMHTTYLSDGSIAGTLIAAMENKSNKHSNSMTAVFWIEDVTTDDIGHTPTRPKADRASISKELRYNVRGSIEGLYSNSPDNRIHSAANLAELGAKATAAVPYLIDLLGDNSSRLPVKRKWFNDSELQSPGSMAAVALRKITGQSFAQDEQAWRSWYQQSPQTLPSGTSVK